MEEEEEEEEDRDKDWVRRGGGKNQTETQLETREEAHTEGEKSHHLSPGRRGGIVGRIILSLTPFSLSSFSLSHHLCTRL